MPDGTVASVFVNEVDMTSLCLEGSVTKRLNNVGQAQAKFNMQATVPALGAPIAPGMLMKVYFDGTLFHHGRILTCETTAGEDGGYTVVNSGDPLELWRYRPVRDPGDTFTSACGTTPPVTSEAGDFSDPQIIQDFITGPEIVEAMCYASEHIALGPDDAEGPLFLDLTSGTFECNGADLTGAPVDWPMTMMELASLLVSTGELDVVCQPIELDGDGNYGELSAYNGKFGTDLHNSVVFSYGMGDFNVRALRWNEDMTDVCNKLWYFLGPKCDQQHWQANVTGTSNMDDCLCCDPDDCMGNPCNDIRDAVVTKRLVTQASLGVRMDIKIFDAVGDQTECILEKDIPPGSYCLYKNLWLREQNLRLGPRTLVHVTPTRDTAIGTFDIGDLITVEATSEVNGGFSGAQRVYSYTVSWDAEESVCALGELQVSSDQESF